MVSGFGADHPIRRCREQQTDLSRITVGPIGDPLVYPESSWDCATAVRS